jgi:hypothetical protein
VVFRVLADATVVLHFAFVVFALLGGLLVLRWPHVAWVHLPAAAWGAWVEFAGSVCPLTPLESWLREQGGQVVYRSSFVEHYLLPVLYPVSLTREIQWALGGIVVLINVAVYIAVFQRRMQR